MSAHILKCKKVVLDMALSNFWAFSLVFYMKGAVYRKTLIENKFNMKFNRDGESNTKKFK